MTFTEAAAEVLRLIGKPLHYKDITEIAIQKNLLSHVGKSPEVTMGSRLAALLKRSPKENPLVRIKPGVFALRTWTESGAPGLALELSPDAPPTSAVSYETSAPNHESSPMAADSSAAFPPPSSGATSAVGLSLAASNTLGTSSKTDELPSHSVEVPRGVRAQAHETDTESQRPAADELLRADLAAGAGGMFAEEDDDDKPIFGSDAPEAPGPRRRRRRRRGRGSEGGPGSAAMMEPLDPSLPSYTVSPAFGDTVSEGEESPVRLEPREARPPRESRRDDARRDDPRRDDPRRDDARRDDPRRDDPRRDDARRDDRSSRSVASEGFASVGETEEPVGRDMADTVATLLTGFDRNAGPVALRSLAEAGQRRARLGGDLAALQTHIAAAVRADNIRRTAAGQRPRFRLAGGRLALTDWILNPELLRFENDVLAALDRYRDATRRLLGRKLTELPSHAFVELCITLLERIGISQLRPVRRSGQNGGEMHFTGVQHNVGGDTRLAIMLRRDGRELGRERVIELRGSMHHYNGSTTGWLITAGQVLSGAREEAAIPGTTPVVLLDGSALARLCEEHQVGVIRTHLPMSLLDLDLLDALRAN